MGTTVTVSRSHGVITYKHKFTPDKYATKRKKEGTPGTASVDTKSDVKKGGHVMTDYSKATKLSEILESVKTSGESAVLERNSLRDGFNIQHKELLDNMHKAIDPDTKTLLEADEIRLKKTYSDALQELAANTDATLREAQEAYEQLLDKRFSLAGDKLDRGTIDLLESPISVTTEELESWGDEYLASGNYSMLRVITDFADNHGVKSDVLKGLQVRMAKDKAAAMASFNRLKDVTEFSISTDEHQSGAWGKSYSRISGETVEATENSPWN